jgi:DNA-directed RNA polymerase specialized sigma24 family protein
MGNPLDRESETTSAMQPASEDEAVLIEKIAAGDPAALMNLYDRTNRLVYAVAFRVLGDKSAAEEVVLDVYTQVWRKAAGFDASGDSALTWLTTIAGARSIDRVGMIPAGSELPEYLRDLLSARLEREPQVPAQPPGKAEAVGKETVHPTAASTPSHATILTPPPQERSRLPWLIITGLAIAAALAFLAWRQADGALQRVSEQLSTAQADVTNLRTLIEVQRERNQELDQINAAMGNRATKIIHLQGQPDAPSASVVVLWDTQKNRWLISGYIPPAPSEKVYQLWFLLPKETVSACLIKTDPLGHIFQSIDIAQDISRLSGASITLEPEGGSSQPTPPIFAAGRVSQ